MGTGLVVYVRNECGGKRRTGEGRGERKERKKEGKAEKHGGRHGEGA